MQIFFWQLDPLILMPFSLLSPFSITRFHFYCLQVLLTRGLLLVLAKSIYYAYVGRIGVELLLQ